MSTIEEDSCSGSSSPGHDGRCGEAVQQGAERGVKVELGDGQSPVVYSGVQSSAVSKLHKLLDILCHWLTYGLR